MDARPLDSVDQSSFADKSFRSIFLMIKVAASRFALGLFLIDSLVAPDYFRRRL
jgi:hypothetical protein